MRSPQQKRQQQQQQINKKIAVVQPVILLCHCWEISDQQFLGDQGMRLSLCSQMSNGQMYTLSASEFQRELQL